MIINDPVVGPLPVSGDVIEWQHVFLMSIGRCYKYRSVVFDSLSTIDDSPRRDGLVHLNNVLFSQFLIEWCKIFGANNNKIHWKKLYVSGTAVDTHYRMNQKTFEGKMRQLLCHHAGITVAEFDKTHKSMTDARDKYAAHLDIGEVPPMPFLEIPYKVANALTVVFGGLVGDRYHPLESYSDTFLAEISATIVLN